MRTGDAPAGAESEFHCHPCSACQHRGPLIPDDVSPLRGPPRQRLLGTQHPRRRMPMAPPPTATGLAHGVKDLRTVCYFG